MAEEEYQGGGVAAREHPAHERSFDEKQERRHICR
jgi:hypothetical protein